MNSLQKQSQKLELSINILKKENQQLRLINISHLSGKTYLQDAKQKQTVSWLKKLFDGNNTQKAKNVELTSNESNNQLQNQKYNKLNQDFKQLKLQNQKLQQQNSNLKKYYQNLMKKESQNSKKAFDLEIIKYQNQYHALIQNFKEKQRIIKQLRQQISKIQKENESTQKQNQLFEKMLQLQKQKSMKKIKSLQQEISNRKQQKQQLQNHIHLLSNQVDHLQKKIKDFKHGIYYQKLKQNNAIDLGRNKIFNRNHLLQGQSQIKLWLIDQIQSFSNHRKIKGSKFVYKYDPQNRSSIHRYINNVPNLLLILKTKEGPIIGAFCNQPLQKKKSLKCDGFLFSSVHMDTYRIDMTKQDSVFLQYDNSYLIYGDQELLFKVQGPEVKIRVNNPKENFFNTLNEKNQSFFGKGHEKDVGSIQTYEFYQIQFEQ